MQIIWIVKRNDKPVPVAIGHISREISRFTKYFLKYSGRIEAKVLHYTNHPQSHQEALKYLRLEKCLISKEKSAIVKQLQKLINLNYEELTSMDAPQNKVIVEKELGQDDNPEDKGIVFIDDGSESYSNYDT